TEQLRRVSGSPATGRRRRKGVFEDLQQRRHGGLAESEDVVADLVWHPVVGVDQPMNDTPRVAVGDIAGDLGHRDLLCHRCIAGNIALCRFTMSWARARNSTASGTLGSLLSVCASSSSRSSSSTSARFQNTAPRLSIFSIWVSSSHPSRSGWTKRISCAAGPS